MPVYLDNNATTALDPRVLDAMLPYMQNIYGNPSGLHRYSRLTRSAIEKARRQLAELIAAPAGQIIFTSGGTEANNLAINGIAQARKKGRLLISAVEHASLREPALALRSQGWQVDEIPVTPKGQLNLKAAEQMIGPDIAMVSVMFANNETGALQPVEELAGICHAKGVLLHTDASQFAGKLPVNFSMDGLSLMTVSAHKFHGPTGIGALVVDSAVDLRPQAVGGGHEKGLRAGTENLSGIVGFGAAAELAANEMAQRADHMRQLLERVESELHKIPEVSIFAAEAERLPGTLQFGVHGCHGETLLLQLDRAGIAVSSGSACHSSVHEPSHVLLAMGVDAELALSAIRVSVSKDTAMADIEKFIKALNDIVSRFRDSSVRAVNS